MASSEKRIEFKQCKKVIYILIVYLALLGIYFFSSTPISIGFYLLITIISFKNSLTPVILIGAGNYLPSLYGVSPIFIAIFIMLIVILQKKIVTREKLLILPKISIKGIIVVGMVYWTLLTGIFSHDISFFSKLFTAAIFMLILVIYYLNISIGSNEILQYFMIGIAFGILLTIFVWIGINGFYSYHLYRLALGERSDPNSTGLLFAILCFYIFINFLDEIKNRKFMFIITLILFMLSLDGLLLTQSRGSVLCLGIAILFYFITTKRRFSRINLISFRNIIFLIVLLVVILAFNKSVFSFVTDSWNIFVNRLIAPESKDGERGYLILMSFKSFLNNPIIGISLKDFEQMAGHITHNTFCDYMVSNGVFGIVFYIVFFIFPLLSGFKKRKCNNIKIPYYSYFICSINILFYSASNEKITFFLLIILQISISEEMRLNYGETYTRKQCE